MAPTASLSPAVTGDATLWTPEGERRIADLVGQTVQAWDGNAFVAVTPEARGDSEELVALTFGTPHGSVVRLVVSDDHIFRVGEDAELVAARDLARGARLADVSAPNGQMIELRQRGYQVLDEAQVVYGFAEGNVPVLFSSVASA